MIARYSIHGPLLRLWNQLVKGSHDPRRGRVPVAQFETLHEGLSPKSAGWIARHFPERQLLIRGPNETIALNFGPRLQIGLLSACAVPVAGVVAVIVSVAWSRHEAHRMGREVASLRNVLHTEEERAAQDRDLLGRLKHEFTKGLAERSRMASDLASSSKTLAERQADIDRLLAEHDAAIEQAFTERARLAAERERAIAERDAALAGNRVALAELDTQTHNAIAEVEKIIASTGVDLNHLAPVKRNVSEDRNAPRGGPFIPWPGRLPSAVGEPDEAVQRTASVMSGLDRLNRLRDLLTHLPISSPVAEVELSSGFGYRLDPITNQASLHEGVDFRAPLDSPVYATADGVVTHAGYSNDYGNCVDIAHGFGLMTRYAHLDKVLVKVGDVVTLHQKLGLMGQTGRATGVHLHYETRVNGQAVNPLNFLKVDHYVPEKTTASTVRYDNASHDHD